MKTLILILAVCLTVIAQQTDPPTFKHNERIEVRYDKFQDSTGIILYRMRPGLNAIGDLPKPFQSNQIDISLIATYPGKGKPERFSGSILMALRFEPNWPEHNLPELILLVDGRREILPARRGVLPSSRTDSRYEAQIEIRYELLVAISNAKQVEGQFCAIEFHFDKDNFEALKDFESRLRP